MTEEKKEAVLNAGPVIHLSEVNCFNAIEIFHKYQRLFTTRLSGMKSLAQKS